MSCETTETITVDKKLLRELQTHIIDAMSSTASIYDNTYASTPEFVAKMIKDDLLDADKIMNRLIHS